MKYTRQYFLQMCAPGRARHQYNICQKHTVEPCNYGGIYDQKETYKAVTHYIFIICDEQAESARGIACQSTRSSVYN